MLIYEKRSKSIKTILFSVLSLIGLLLLIALTIIVSVSGARLNEITLAKQSNQITDLILSSSGLWAQERGLTNLELNANTPATPAVIARIRSLREKADTDYRRALDLLPYTRLSADPAQQQAFNTAFAHLQSLRTKLDKQLALSGDQRDPTLKVDWFPSISQVIEQSQLSALHYTSQARNTTSVVAKDAIARHNLWLMSEYAGRERGLMAGIIASGRPISPAQMNALLEYRAYVMEGWRIITSLEMRPDEKAVLEPPMAKVRATFFGDYDALRLRLVAEGVAGKRYSVSGQNWFDSATEAINDILALEKANTSYVDDRLEHQQRDQTLLLWLCAAFIVLGVAVIVGAFWVVNRHVLYSVSNLKAIIENAGEGLITIDTTGRIKSFNPACERIFRANANESLGRNIRDFMPEPYKSAHDSYLTHFHKTGRGGIIGTVGREVTGCRLDGEEFPMELSISQFELEDGVHYCGVVRDVSAAKQAECDRQNLLEKLIESNTELERFAYVASHDMQEPIRMVMTFSQVIVEDYGAQMDDQGREYLQVLSESAHRMLGMIQDLLQYARLGAESMTRSDVDMNEELSQVKINLAELISETSAIIDCGPLPHVAGNPVQLQRVLQNLVSNGIKYQPAGQQPYISIRVQDEETHWLFSVSDNGIGIEDEFFGQIFEPFRRLHTQNEIKGTGFGLSIVKKIIETHGGRISVTSDPGIGSAFSFSLEKTRPNYE